VLQTFFRILLFQVYDSILFHNLECAYARFIACASPSGEIKLACV